MIKFALLISRQGKTRLTKWYQPYSKREKARILREVCSLVLPRPSKLCNFLEWREGKIIYKRYASLYFVMFVDREDNELLTLEKIHIFVEVLDRHFSNVCELDLIFNFHQAYFILDELVIAGELQESSKKRVLKACTMQDALMEHERQNKSKKNSQKSALPIPSVLL